MSSPKQAIWVAMLIGKRYLTSSLFTRFWLIFQNYQNMVNLTGSPQEQNPLLVLVIFHSKELKDFPLPLPLG